MSQILGHPRWPTTPLASCAGRQPARKWKKAERSNLTQRDKPWLGRALECGNLLPEVIEHGVGRRMPVVRASVHFATGDDVDAGQFLVQDRGLASAILRVHHRCHRQLTDRDEPIQ